MQWSDEVKEIWSRTIGSCSGSDVTLEQALIAAGELADLASFLSNTSEWQPINTAPRDGRCLLLLSIDDRRCAIGRWFAEGTSWTDQFGSMDGDEVCQLSKTGVWFSGSGWFQPNEVSHWMPLPDASEREQ